MAALQDAKVFSPVTLSRIDGECGILGDAAERQFLARGDSWFSIGICLLRLTRGDLQALPAYAGVQPERPLRPAGKLMALRGSKVSYRTSAHLWRWNRSRRMGQAIQ